MAESVNVQGSYRSALSAHSLWPVVFYCLAVIALFHETVWSLLAIWNRSETYMHGYLIAPISLWLIWSRRGVLSSLPIRPDLSVQALVLLVGLIWLLAQLIDVLVVQQFALVGLLVVGIWSLVGTIVARALAFPLGFLFLAVPVGDDLVPPMMEFTATSTVFLVKMTGIPVYREGMYITLPSGSWSVVYACSGIRYLIAAFTLGVLYAYLTYRSPVRRLLFALVSIVVPVLANSVRAYIIVMLGHLSDMRIATGVDHLIYGWVFFGLVMFLLFWLGSFWREDDDDSPAGANRTVDPVQPTVGSLSPWIALLPALVAVAVWPAFASILSNTQKASVEHQLLSPEPAAGWQSIADARWDWRPMSRAPDRESIRFYAAGDQVVALYLSQYLQQEQGSEMISGIDLFVAPDQDWHVTSRGLERVKLGDNSVSVDRVSLALGDEKLLVWSWFRIGEHYTANRYEAKIWELIETLTFSDRGSTNIVLVTDTLEGQGGDEVLQSFVAEHLEAIETTLASGLMGQ